MSVGRLWIVALLVFLGGAAATAQADPMAFRLVQVGGAPGACTGSCVEVISAEGEITDATPRTFAEFAGKLQADSRARAVVFLHSPGGKVVASMRLGTMLRAAGAAVIIARVQSMDLPDGRVRTVIGSGRCFSACVYAMMGGAKRVVPPQSLVGIHRMFSMVGGLDPDVGVVGPHMSYDTGEVSSRLSAYAGTMGVSQDLVTAAEHVDSSGLHIVTPKEIRRWRLAVPRF